jgi:hypothetical protein
VAIEDDILAAVQAMQSDVDDIKQDLVQLNAIDGKLTGMTAQIASIHKVVAKIQTATSGPKSQPGAFGRYHARRQHD